MRTVPMLKSVLALSLAALTAATALGGAATAQAATARRPVVFVHGLSGGPNLVFGDMLNRFRAAGYTDAELDLWSYNWKQPNVVTARELAAEVDRVRSRTGWQTVDVVSHSMGSISSRHYLKEHGGAARVTHWVSIAGANHGASVAKLCTVIWDSCKDMKADSDILKKLNTGDETPGATKYLTLAADKCDVMVHISSVHLEGADNQVVPGCYEHISMPKSEKVYAPIKAFLAR